MGVAQLQMGACKVCATMLELELWAAFTRPLWVEMLVLRPIFLSTTATMIRSRSLTKRGSC